MSAKPGEAPTDAEVRAEAEEILPPESPAWRQKRPRNLTPDVANQIIESVQAGNALTVAASAAGVQPQTFRLWMERGLMQKSGIYRDFRMAVEEAGFQSEERLVGIIANSALDSWDAAAWLLERKWPARWGQRVQVTVEMELQKAMDKLRRHLPPKEFDKVLEALASDQFVEQPQLPAGEVTVEMSPPAAPGDDRE
jgi:hypothetical protein